MAAAVYAEIGESPTIEVLDANGSILVTFALGADWGDLGSGSITLNDTPISASAAGSGTVASFRLKSSTGTQMIAGSVSLSTGDGDIFMDRLQTVAGMLARISSWRLYVA